MATIVTQYNPWREQLAVNFLGGLLNNMIQRNQQRADNRIQNRAIADWISSNEPVTTNYLGTQQNPQTLTDGWTNAFHQGTNELANFDMNMASIAPQITGQQQTQPYDKFQILNNLARTIGSNRDYQALNPEQMMKLANPYIEAAEKARQEYNTRQLAEEVMNADNYRDKLNELTGGMISGDISHDVYDSVLNQYKYDNPYYKFSNIDSGDKNQVIATNPLTGQAMTSYSINKGINPDTTARLETQQYGIDTNANVERERIAESRLTHEQDYNIRTRSQDEIERRNRYQEENPNLIKISDSEGGIYFAHPQTGKIIEAVKPNGERITDSSKLKDLRIVQADDGSYVVIDPHKAAATKVTTQTGEPVTGVVRGTQVNPNRDLSDSDKERLNDLRSEVTALIKEREGVQRHKDMFADEPDSPTYKSFVSRLTEIDNRISEIRAEQSQILNPSLHNKSKRPQFSQSGKPISNDISSVPPTSADNTSNDVFMPFPISNDNVPQQTSPDINPISQPTQVSNDIRTTSQNSEPVVNPSPRDRKPGDIVKVNIPKEMFYDETRDKGIDNKKLFTEEQLKNYLNVILLKNKVLTPEQILSSLVKQGFRVKISNKSNQNKKNERVKPTSPDVNIDPLSSDITSSPSNNQSSSNMSTNPPVASLTPVEHHVSGRPNTQRTQTQGNSVMWNNFSNGNYITEKRYNELIAEYQPLYRSRAKRMVDEMLKQEGYSLNGEQQQNTRHLTTPVTPTPARQNNRQNVSQELDWRPSYQKGYYNNQNRGAYTKDNNKVENNEPAKYVNQKGEVLTQSQYDEMLRKALAGELPGIHTKSELDMYLWHTRGFKTIPGKKHESYPLADNLNFLNGLSENRG